MNQPSNPNPPVPTTDEEATPEELVRRLTRLIVGIILVGDDTLSRLLPAWEAEARQRIDRQANQKELIIANPPIDYFSAEPLVTPPPSTPWFPKRWEHVLVGLAFEAPNYMKGAIRSLSSTPKKIWKRSEILRLPLDMLGISDITQSFLEELLEQVRSDIDRLESIGQAEAGTSRALGQVAVENSLNSVISSLADNKNIQDLIQSQGIDLTTEVVEEVRERTVSLDNLVDSVVRRIFRLQKLDPPVSSDDINAPQNRRNPNW